MFYHNEYWTVTAGDLTQKRQRVKTPAFLSTARGKFRIIVDPARKKQKWVGVGAALTDVAASLIWKQTPEQRKKLLEELFSPAQGNLNLLRIPMGSCDFGSGEVSLARYYSYDDAPYDQPDLKLKNFSIGQGKPGSQNATKDLKYIVPVLQEILKINPQVKILATPWSAPAWMKDTKRMEKGGHFRKDICRQTLLKCYAQYFLKFIRAYQKLGIPIAALSIQNEPNFDTPWPAMIWTMRELADFGAHYLKPALYRDFSHIKLYFWDGSLDQLDDSLTSKISPEEINSFAGLAFHTYFGPYKNIDNARRVSPHWELAMTERRCLLNQTVADASHIMLGLIGTYLVRRGLSSIYLWNLALDERGLPNIAGSTGRRGVITIDHQTGKVQRNLEYYMLRNFAQDVAPGSFLVASSDYMKNSYSGGLGSTAFIQPDHSLAGQIYNPTAHSLTACLQIKGASSWQTISVPAYGVVTFHKSNQALNESAPRADEIFKLHPIAPQLVGDAAPGK